MSSFAESIRDAVRGQHPIVYLQTAEEDRVLDLLRELSREHFQLETMTIWTCTRGLDGTPDTREPTAAINAMIDQGMKGFVIFKDLSGYMKEPAVLRAIRDAYYAILARGDATLVILSPEMVVPPIIEKEVYLVEVELPQARELMSELSSYEAKHALQLPEGLASELALSLRGLTLNEVRHILHRVRHAGENDADAIRDRVFAAKEMLVKKTGYLEYVPVHRDLASIGGQESLKEWIDKRQNMFNQEAMESGLPMPKGILLMGVSGCGKSLAAKTVAARWRIPLFRLDFNVIFSGLYGSPEATFHNALKTIESIAPAIVWIDEIENGLGVTISGSPDANQIFSAFLTWMQEKPPLIFVAATANNIQLLPAEIIRKGRFDQVFFCDLPDEKEREEILKIHLGRQGANVADFDLSYLTVATEGWNGAEIEQAVIAARIDAHQEGRTITTRDVTRHARQIVPLSETMSEQIKAIREWAWGRATPASGKKSRL